MKLVATEKSEQNRALLDPWTLVHFSAGLAAGLMNLPREPALGAAVAYEVVEQVLERHELGQEVFDTSGPESVENAVLDVVVFAVGHWLGERWNADGD